MKNKLERRSFTFDVRATEGENGEKIITGRPIVYESKTDLGLCYEVIARGALPKYESDKKKNYAIASLFLGYYHQLHDMLEDYYEYLDVDEQVKQI